MAEGRRPVFKNTQLFFSSPKKGEKNNYLLVGILGEGDSPSPRTPTPGGCWDGGPLPRAGLRPNPSGGFTISLWLIPVGVEGALPPITSEGACARIMRVLRSSTRIVRARVYT